MHTTHYHQACVRVGRYLHSKMGCLPTSFDPEVAPHYVEISPGSFSSKVDPFSEFLAECFQSSFDSIYQAVQGNPLPANWWLIEIPFDIDPAVDELAAHVETPVAATSLPAALNHVDIETTERGLRIEWVWYETTTQSVNIRLTCGAIIQIRQIPFSAPAPTFKKASELFYRGLRMHGEHFDIRLRDLSPFANARAVGSLHDLHFYEQGLLPENWIQPPQSESSPPSPRGSHLCPHPKSLARALQRSWNARCSTPLPLSLAQEAVARFCDAGSWNQLIAIDPNTYWNPCFVSCRPGLDHYENRSILGFYRNPIDGLAAFADTCQNTSLEMYSISSSSYASAQVSIEASTTNAYYALQPFTFTAQDQGKFAGLEDPTTPHWAKRCHARLTAWAQPAEFLRRRDVQNNWVSQIVGGYRATITEDRGYKRYVRFFPIDASGETKGLGTSICSDDAVLIFTSDPPRYHLIDSRQCELVATFDRGLSDDEKQFLASMIRDVFRPNFDELCITRKTITPFDPRRHRHLAKEAIYLFALSSPTIFKRYARAIFGEQHPHLHQICDSTVRRLSERLEKACGQANNDSSSIGAWASSENDDVFWEGFGQFLQHATATAGPRLVTIDSPSGVSTSFVSGNTSYFDAPDR